MLLAACATSAATQAPKLSPYLGWANEGSFVKPPTGNIKLGLDGVPIVKYPSGWENNPTTTAQWGLQELDYSIHGRKEHRVLALRAADWLVKTQQHDGAWVYAFADVNTDGQVLTPPWRSALAQGNAMSLLVRIWQVTGQSRYLSAAKRAVAPLQVDTATGGLRATLNGGTIFEEYPTLAPPQHVLNGFLFTLIGLHDLAATGDRPAGRLYDEGRTTLEANLGRWDQGGLPAYDLTDRLIHHSYDPIHRYLLVEMLAERETPQVRHWLDTWYRP